jgi:type I restriction enzyme S subunit
MVAWQLQPLGCLCEFVRGPFGGSLKKSIFKPSGFAVYEQQHAIYDQFTKIRYFVDENKFEEMKRFELLPGDLIMSCSGTMGKVAIVPENIKQGIINQALLKLTPTENISVEFLKYWMGSPGFQDELNRQSQGVAIKNVASVKVLKDIKIPLPPLPEQKRIVAILDEAFAGIDAAVANTEKNLANARELFESYLNAVFTQKGDGWVEKKLGDADLIQIIDGDRGVNYPKKTDFFDEGFCLFLNTKNVRPDGFNFDTTMFITEEKDKALRKGKLKRRDVLLTTRGTIGNIALYNERVDFDEIRINSGMLIFRPNEKVILSEYLFEILRSGIMKSQTERFVSGAAQPQLPIKTLVNFTIPVPVDLSDQEQIVYRLKELYSETQRLEAIYQQKIEALAELKQSILQKAFAGELTAMPEQQTEEASA